jgi:hypothetical protein
MVKGSMSLLVCNGEMFLNNLIENQLEATDHSRLEQILTYLPGLDAKAVVWIATRFRGAHLSAIKWLNEHTPEDFDFFAVRLNKKAPAAGRELRRKREAAKAARVFQERGFYFFGAAGAAA